MFDCFLLSLRLRSVNDGNKSVAERSRSSMEIKAR